MDVVATPVRRLVRRPPVAVDLGTSLRDVAAILSEERIGAVLVHRAVTADRSVMYPAGIVSERDVNRAIAARFDPDAAQAGDVMTVDMAYADADDTIHRVATRMLAHGIRHLPIRDGDAVIGVVSERDVLGALLQELQDQRRGMR